MEHRRTEAYDAHRKEYHKKTVGKGQYQQTQEGEAHTDGERKGTGMAVGRQACERLQYGRGHLKHQCDETNLGEREPELILEHRIDGRNDRLNHVVEKM